MSRSVLRGSFTGWHMAAIMVSFFGVIIVVNFTMAYLAGNTWTGLVVKNSYVASQNFNTELETAREQMARQWQSSLVYEDGLVSFALFDKDRNPVLVEGLTVLLGRPAFEQKDRKLALAYQGKGIYTADIVLGGGIWTARVEGGLGQKHYRQEFRFTVRPPEAG